MRVGKGRGARVRRVPEVPRGVQLGCRRGGERVLPQRGAELVLPFEDLSRHVLVAGSTGSGKTETALRVAYDVAVGTDAPVFVLDAKGDRGTAERFVGLMREAGRQPRVFPNERFDAWRGDATAVINRLLEVIAFVESGPAAFYRDIAKVVVQLACRFESGPPRSSVELLWRLDYERLQLEHGAGSTAIQSVRPEQVDQVRMRYEAFFGQLGTRLDGDWAWEDADSGYLLLDSVALGEDARSAACLLFADFAHYFTMRKEREQFVLLLVDEFAAIASATDVARTVAQARIFNAGLVLIPQTVSGLGDREQRDAVMGNTATAIVHAMPEPDELARLAGTRPVVELTRHYERGVFNDDGASREAERAKVTPNDVRELAVGTAWVIRGGRAGKLAVGMAPTTTASLPEEEACEPERQPPPPKAEAPSDVARIYGEG